MHWLAIVSPILLAGAFTGVTSPPAAPCDVTKPNGVMAGTEAITAGSYGNRHLSVGPFGLWPDGTVVFKPGGPGFVTQDGSLGMKFGWTRMVSGQLKIEGHRIDGPAKPLRAETSPDNLDSGFIATSLVFSTPGCWEVTGHVGNDSVTFVTMVTRIGDGPSWRREIR